VPPAARRRAERAVAAATTAIITARAAVAKGELPAAAGLAAETAALNDAVAALEPPGPSARPRKR
jgi:hypothetical protein